MAHRRENGLSEPDETRIRKLGGAFTAALLSGDEVAAEIAIREAMDANLSTPEIDEKVIAPALWLVGELWERGTISVAEEHIATEISVRVLALQREAQCVARSRSERRVMIAAPAGELGAIDEVRQARPSAGFVVGGRGVTVEGQLRPQVHICERVSDAVEAVDAMVQRAGLN